MTKKYKKRRNSTSSSSSESCDESSSSSSSSSESSSCSSSSSSSSSSCDSDFDRKCRVKTKKRDSGNKKKCRSRTKQKDTDVEKSSSETTTKKDNDVDKRSTETTNKSDTDVEKSSTETAEKSIPGAATWPFFWLLPFGLMWLGIFYFVVLKYATDLPTALTIADEPNNTGRFIAERAEKILTLYEVIGPKIVGSYPNENLAVALLLSEIAKITPMLNTTLFTLDVEVQQVSGEFTRWGMLSKYQGIQNVVARLSPLPSNSTAYLLINTHFDSEPESPGSGDAGTMVVVMLEVIRVIGSGSSPLSHPIVFLFNGAEETPLQGSHGFITAHRWATNCKVVINLDSCGSGGRDIVFREGTGNPWLMETYKTAAVHPHGTSFAEELYQLDVYPANTDFTIFQKYGSIPGLDIAHYNNGYVYHTKYDKMNVIPRETLQNTGDNILSLAKALANAPELEDPSVGRVFYDIFSRYLVIYSTTIAVQLNYGVVALAVVMKIVFELLMSRQSKVSLVGFALRSALALAVHVIGIVLGAGLAIGMAILLDILGVPMSWFTFRWMVMGLYFCPFIFGFGFPTALLIGFMNTDKLDLASWIQLILLKQLFVVALLCAGLTYFEYKSAYLFMLATLFYTLALIFNMVTTLSWRGFYWFFVVVLFQIPAFIYFTYLGFVGFSVMIPLTGHSGDDRNPDLYIAGFAVAIGFLSLGFVVPLVNVFRKSKLALFGALIVAVLFTGLALSPFVFPFREETNVERFRVMHTRRVFHEADNTISKNESGFYFNLQDRRGFSAVTSAVNTSEVISMSSQCDQFMFCGLPVFNHRWNEHKRRAKYLLSNDVVLPEVPILTLLSRIDNTTDSTIQFNFRLNGPAFMGIQIQPEAGSNVTDWSFIKDMLVERWEPPYFIFFSKGKDQSALEFFLEFEKAPVKFFSSTFEIGIGGHYISAEYARGNETAAFIASFPSYTFPMVWPASYEKWVY